jgi:hypothetical protein
MKHPLLRYRDWLPLVVVVVAFAGCGDSGPRVVEISGRVSRGGKPVKDLTVHFMPQQGRPSWGLTDADGRYTLHYSREKDGAVVGKHKVYVTYDPPTNDPGAYYGRMEGRFEAPDDIKAILQEYGDVESTPLEFEIEEKREDLDLQLD